MKLLEGLGCEHPSGNYVGLMPADNGNQMVTLGEAYTYARDQVSGFVSQYLDDSEQMTAQCYGDTSQVLFRRK